MMKLGCCMHTRKSTSKARSDNDFSGLLVIVCRVRLKFFKFEITCDNFNYILTRRSITANPDTKPNSNLINFVKKVLSSI